MVGAGVLHDAAKGGKLLLDAGNLTHPAATAQGVAHLEWGSAQGFSRCDAHLVAGNILPATCTSRLYRPLVEVRIELDIPGASATDR